MTDQDAAKILDILTGAYPRFYAGASDDALDSATDIWASVFVDDDPRLVMAAVKSFIESDEKGFPPVPGQIKGKIRLITEQGEMTELEAWGIVAKALKNSGYGAKEEFDKFPPIIRRIVGSPAQLRDWGMMDSETVHSVLASNFQRSYRAIAAKEREFERLPPDVRELAARIAAAKSTRELPGEIMPDLQETSAESEKVTDTLTERIKKKLESVWKPSQKPSQPPEDSEPRRSREEVIAILRGNSE